MVKSAVEQVNTHAQHRHHTRMFMRHFDSKTSKLLEEDQHSPWFKIVLCSPAIALFLLLSWMVRDRHVQNHQNFKVNFPLLGRVASVCF